MLRIHDGDQARLSASATAIRRPTQWQLPAFIPHQADGFPAFPVLERQACRAKATLNHMRDV
jgi:hypothetical protein